MQNICEFKQEVVINYPLDWNYKVIGISVEAISNAFNKISSIAKSSLDTKIKSSSNKSFVSMQITSFVSSKAQKDEIFAILKNQEGIKFVL